MRELFFDGLNPAKSKYDKIEKLKKDLCLNILYYCIRVSTKSILESFWKRVSFN